MHPYLPHLLADIESAHRIKTSEVPEPLEISFEEHMEQVERYASGPEPDYTFSFYCGLKAEQFPPPEQLTGDDMKLVCEAFRTMMLTWNLDAAFPERLPIERAYSLLVGTLNENTMIVDMGCIYFDYCTGYAPDCVLKEYCRCLEYWESDK